MSMRWSATVLGTTLLLTGCASSFRVDNQVQSYARWAEATPAHAAVAAPALPQAPQTYRFERLPSQREGEAAQRQDGFEALAREVLAPLGWTLADGSTGTTTGVRWTVQISASGLRLARDPWSDGGPRFWPGFSLGLSNRGVTAGGQLLWGPGFGPTELPQYQRQVSLLVRETATGRVVYETQAAHESRWHGTPDLWRAMISAALQDFPAPPPGVRQVNIDLPR